MKKFVLIIFVFFLIFPISYAADEFNINKAYVWLNSSINSRNWDLNVDELSYGILALDKAGSDVSKGVTVLEGKKRSDGSWNGKVYDTSLAILALSSKNRNIDSSVLWIIDKQRQSRSTGEWLVQIRSDSDYGNCDINMGERTKTFTFNGSKVSCNLDGDGYGSWINIEKCIGPVGMHSEVDINCNQLGLSDISLIYKDGENYHIIDDKYENVFNAEIDIQNAYLGSYKDTIFATWVLKTVGKEEGLYSISYLEGEIDNDVVNNALLYVITRNQVYVSKLNEIKGSFVPNWGNNVIASAYGVMATSDSDVVDWLKREQRNDGSWNGKILDTALVLYTEFRGVGGVIDDEYDSSFCGNGILDPATEECEIDDHCAVGKGCVNCQCVSSIVTGPCTSDYACGFDEECINGECVPITDEEPCVSKYDCDYLNQECVNGECVEVTGDAGCQNDGECDPGKECLYGSCVEKQQPSGGSSNWIIILIIIVAIGVVGYYLLTKFKKKSGGGRGKKQTFSEFLETRQGKPSHSTPKMQPYRAKTPTQTRTSVVSNRDLGLERELDEAIKKAKNLFKK